MSHVISQVERVRLTNSAEVIVAIGCAIDAMLAVIEENEMRKDEGEREFVTPYQRGAMLSGVRVLAGTLAGHAEPLGRFVQQAAVARESLEVQPR